MKDYIITTEDGKQRIVTLGEQQIKYINQKFANNESVPLYSTTYAKKKYGDCIIGNIIKFELVS